MDSQHHTRNLHNNSTGIRTCHILTSHNISTHSISSHSIRWLVVLQLLGG